MLVLPNNHFCLGNCWTLHVRLSRLSDCLHLSPVLAAIGWMGQPAWGRACQHEGPQMPRQLTGGKSWAPKLISRVPSPVRACYGVSCAPHPEFIC